MNLTSDNSLEYLAFFFVDVVGLSNPILSTTTQTTKLNSFNYCVSQCKTFKSTPRDQILFLPTGDGMVIGFKNNALEKPLHLALEFHEKLNQYNQDKPQSGKIFTRIGLHVGSIFTVKDVFGVPAAWGPGIILARRVMDLGDENHILMTAEMADALFELSEDYRKIIHPVHNYRIKHNQTMLLYSVHGDNFGNSKRPIKGLDVEEKTSKLAQEITNKISYDQIMLDLFLDSRSNLLKCKKTFHFTNISDEPIFVVLAGINTSIEKSLFELNVKAFDENNRPLSIIGVNLDTPFRKEFSLKLNSPVYKNEKNKKYLIIYDEENNQSHESLFLTNAKNFLLIFDFPTESKLKPQLNLIFDNTDQILKLSHDREESKGSRTKISWSKTDGISSGSMIQVKW